MDVLKRVPIREQEPKVRAANFEEVCLGYTQEEAQEEASRCLNCKNAQCVKGCPVSINIPKFISEVKRANLRMQPLPLLSPAPFPLSAAVYVLRRASARENVSAASRASRFLSESWSVL